MLSPTSSPDLIPFLTFPTATLVLEAVGSVSPRVNDLHLCRVCLEAGSVPEAAGLNTPPDHLRSSEAHLPLPRSRLPQQWKSMNKLIDNMSEGNIELN